MEYNGTFVTTKIKDLGLPYLRGILHTYASLNQPESNLSYEYDIIQIKKGESDLKASLITEFEVFSDQPFNITLSDEKNLRQTLLSWLFENQFVSDKKIKNITDHFYKTLQQVTDFTSISLINLDFIKYDFGVAYEYYVLESELSWYLLYFTYSD